MQTRKSQHYPQRRKKIFEKQRNYYDKNVDFLIEKKRFSNKPKNNSSENRSELFTKLIKEGTTYTCAICNKSMHQNGTKKFDQNKYICPFDINWKFNTSCNMYICLTCHGHLKKQKSTFTSSMEEARYCSSTRNTFKS